MNKSRVLVSSIALALFGTAMAMPAQAERREVLPTVAAVGSQQIFLTKGQVSNQAPRTSSTSTNNLTYHLGPVMTNQVAITPIYWGTKWSTATTNDAFRADKALGLDTLYKGYNMSNHALISTQYTQTGGAKVSQSVLVNAGKVDTATSLTTNNPSTTTIANTVTRNIPFADLSVDGYYPVYTDIARGSAGFCAWHSWATVSSGGVSKTIKFAFFFNLDGDSGCSASSSVNSFSTGTQSLANVSIHELAEAMTDPQLNAWYDSRGYENADKCAWNFGPGSVTLGSTNWKIQGEWDNKTGSCKW